MLLIKNSPQKQWQKQALANGGKLILDLEEA